MAEKILRRSNRNNVAIQKRADGVETLVGYASVYWDEKDAGTEYRLDEMLVERIMPGAFDVAITRDDVRVFFNHDVNFVLGRVKAGTARLSVDKVGLRYEVDLPNTTAGRDVAESVGRGDITGSSFAFVPINTTYKRDAGGLVIVERNEVALFDVSPVTFPAYESASVGLRGVTDADHENIKKEVALFRRRSVSRLLARSRACEVVCVCDA